MSGNLRVAILAGGFGSRLGELTRTVPKPMIEVAGRPYLEHVILSFADRGLQDFVLLTGYRSDVIEQYFGDGSSRGLRILYSRESEPLGTGGALRDARQLLGERFVVTYGDVLRRFDYERFVRSHGEPCLAVYPRLSIGNTAIEGDRVIRFDKNAPDLPYIDAGFSLMDAAALSLIASRGAASYEESIFPQLAARGGLACEVVDHEFCDIGTPEELARTRAILEKDTT